MGIPMGSVMLNSDSSIAAAERKNVLVCPS